MPQPYVLLSAAVSLDGYLDDTGPERLLLSEPGRLRPGRRGAGVQSTPS